MPLEKQDYTLDDLLGNSSPQEKQDYTLDELLGGNTVSSIPQAGGNDKGLLSDLSYQTTSAVNTGLAGLARTGDVLFGDGKDGAFIQRLDENAAYAQSQLSPRQQQANQKQFFSDQPGEFFGEAWTDPRKYSGLAADAVGSLIPIALTGGPISGGLKGLATGLGAKAGGKVAATAGALGYGVPETAMVTGSVAGDIQRHVNDMPEEVLLQSPRYQELLSGMDKAQARAELGRELGVKGMKDVALPSLLLGTVAGKYLDDALTGRLSGNPLYRGTTMAGVEGTTEAGQGGSEQLVKNLQLGQVDPAVTPLQGVGEAAFSEGIGGGMLGGVGGAISPNFSDGPLTRAAKDVKPTQALDPNVNDEANQLLNEANNGGTISRSETGNTGAGVGINPASVGFDATEFNPYYRESEFANAVSPAIPNADTFTPGLDVNNDDGGNGSQRNRTLADKINAKPNKADRLLGNAKTEDIDELINNFAVENPETVTNTIDNAINSVTEKLQRAKRKDAKERISGRINALTRLKNSLQGNINVEQLLESESEREDENRTTEGAGTEPIVDPAESGVDAEGAGIEPGEQPVVGVSPEAESSGIEQAEQGFVATHEDPVTGEVYQYIRDDVYRQPNGEEYSFDEGQLSEIQQEAEEGTQQTEGIAKDDVTSIRQEGPQNAAVESADRTDTQLLGNDDAIDTTTLESTLPNQAEEVEIKGDSVQESEIDEKIKRAEQDGIVLSENDKKLIKEKYSASQSLLKKVNVNTDPMGKGDAFPMGVGYTKMTRRKERALDNSVRQASKAVERWNRIEGLKKEVEGLLQGKGMELDNKIQSEKKEKAKVDLAKKVLSLKKGDKLGGFSIERITNDRDGYPSSIVFSGEGIIKGVNNKINITRDYFGNDKNAYRKTIDAIRNDKQRTTTLPETTQGSDREQPVTTGTGGKDEGSGVAKQAWEMTQDEFFDHSLETNEYRDSYKQDEELLGDFKKDTAPKWVETLKEAARNGLRLPDNVIDDYVDKYGEGALQSVFRGVYEEGIEGWMPKDIREQKPSKQKKRTIHEKETYERTWAEQRKVINSSISRKLSKAEWAEEKNNHLNEIRKAQRENKNVPEKILREINEKQTTTKAKTESAAQEAAAQTIPSINKKAQKAYVEAKLKEWATKKAVAPTEAQRKTKRAELGKEYKSRVSEYGIPYSDWLGDTESTPELRTEYDSAREELGLAVQKSEVFSNNEQAEKMNKDGDVAPKHIEEGKAEDASLENINNSLTESSESQPNKSKPEMKEWLVKEINKAILKAESEKDLIQPTEYERKNGLSIAVSEINRVGHKTFNVPGDGKFKVLNTKEHLEKFKKKVLESSGFKETRKQARKKQAPRRTDAQKLVNQYLREAKTIGNDLDYINQKKLQVEHLEFAKQVAENNGLDTSEINSRLESLDVKFSQSAKTKGSTKEEITRLIRKQYKNLAPMLESGKIRLVSMAEVPAYLKDNAEKLYEALRSGKEIKNLEGMYNPKTDETLIVYDMVSEDTLGSTLYHELFHRLVASDPVIKEYLIGSQSELAEIFNLIKEGKYRGRYKTLYEAAQKRIPAKTPEADLINEFGAYSLSLYNQGNDLPARLKRWAKELIARIKRALRMMGVKVTAMTPADLQLILKTSLAYDAKAGDGGPLASTQESTEDVKLSVGVKGTNTSWRNEKGFEGVSEETFETLNKIGKPPGETFKEKFKTYFDKHRYLWRNKLRQGLVDQYDSFSSVLNDKKAWMMASLSNTGGSVAEAALEFGQPFMDKSGAVDIDTNKKSLAQIVEPLGEELDRFLMWIAGNRAEGLKLDGKENLFSDEDINNLKGLADGEINGENRKGLYNRVRKDFERMHNAIVQMGVDTGLVSQEDAALWKEQGFYIPFYRLADESADNHGPQSISGLVRQQAYKKLKGADMQLDDLLGNTLMNWNHLIGSSLKNQAATKALNTAVRMGLAKEIPATQKSKKAVFVRDNGKEKWYELDDSTESALVLDSLTALNYDGLNNVSMKAMRKFKRALTTGVTSNPEFKVANLIRDSLQAIAVADMSTNIAKNLLQGFKATKKGTDTKARMIAGGGAFGDSGYIHGADPDAIKLVLEKGINRATILDSRNKWKKVWDVYQDFGSRLENVNRAAEFEQSLAKGKDLLTANFSARDQLDFQRTGSFVAIRALSQMVPFLNARLQGLDKLGRSMIDAKQRKQFTAVVGTYALASVALYLAMKDDEDYKEAEQWERDTYHLFKVPGSDIMYRIPRPFEVGAIANMIERAAEQMVDDTVHGELFAERLWHSVSETFAMNPMPQMFKPVIETWANKNSFTGRSIESQSLQRLSKTERKKAWTSQTAIGISKALDSILWDEVVLSPVQVEHLVNGYLGWVGATTLGAVDTLARPLAGAADRPDKRIEDYPIIGRFMREGKAKNSRFITEFYNNQREISQRYADIKRYRDNQEYDKYQEALLEHKDELKYRKMYNRAQRRMSEINKRIRLITANKKLSGATKRKRIDKLNESRIRIARRAVERFAP